MFRLEKASCIDFVSEEANFPSTNRSFFFTCLLGRTLYCLSRLLKLADTFPARKNQGLAIEIVQWGHRQSNFLLYINHKWDCKTSLQVFKVILSLVRAHGFPLTSSVWKTLHSRILFCCCCGEVFLHRIRYFHR